MTHHDPSQLPDDARDAYADQVAVTDPGPDTLDQPDEPDPTPDRDPGPRPDDGAQDAPQDTRPDRDDDGEGV